LEASDLAHGLAHAMRTSLARAALAAGQLERDGATPRARRLAGTVSGSVVELDRLIGELISLVVRAARPRQRADLRGPLADLRARHAAPLAARGIEWIASDDAPGPLVGDPAVARRAAALLLRVLAAQAPSGGRLSLEASSEPQGWSLAARVEIDGAAAPAEASARASAPLADLRALAARAGASLEHEHGARVVALRLRFPDDSCRAS
jgi:signal transduction histidine kinase